MSQATHVARRALGPYLRDLRPLREATGADQLRAWFATQTAGGFGFNGDVLRASVVRGLFEVCGCDVFLETGTYRAATSLLAARLLRCPVYTSELNRRFWLLAWLRCAPFMRVHPRYADSREFLVTMTRELLRSAVPFVYLDAHWNEDLPLQRELDILFSAWQRFVVLIDDFQVPGRPGFGFDTYAGRPLSVDTIRFPVEKVAAPSGVYFPAYEAADDTGGRRGYVVLAAGLRDRVAAAQQFPLNLLREHVLTSADAPSPR
ncbi:MAG: hypothetical protein HY908_22910 [Myxococcales bacterium]|nr:hypothetical protein [Myxococcales bacterium]